MQRFLLLAFAGLLSACSYTGDALRNAGAGGTAPAFDPPAREDPAEAKQDPRFAEPVRPGTGHVSVR